MDPAFLYGKYMKAVDKKKQRGGQGQQQREKEKKRDREKKTEKENEKLAKSMTLVLEKLMISKIEILKKREEHFLLEKKQSHLILCPRFLVVNFSSLTISEYNKMTNSYSL